MWSTWYYLSLTYNSIGVRALIIKTSCSGQRQERRGKVIRSNGLFQWIWRTFFICSVPSDGASCPPQLSCWQPWRYADVRVCRRLIPNFRVLLIISAKTRHAESTRWQHYLIFSRNGYSSFSMLMLIFLIKMACQKGNLNQIDATQDAINIVSLTFLLIILSAHTSPLIIDTKIKTDTQKREK